MGQQKLYTLVTEKAATISHHLYHCVTCTINYEDACMRTICIKSCKKGHNVSMVGLGYLLATARVMIRIFATLTRSRSMRE